MSSLLEHPSLAGSKLERYFHVCAFFDDRAQEYSVLGSFYKEGLDHHEKALHIVGPDRQQTHRDELKRLGIDVHECEKAGKLEVITPNDCYLAGGVFDPDKMLVTVDNVLAAAKKRGFHRTRIMGSMDWAFDGAPGSDRLIEYEARVNEVLARTRQPAICVYDTKKLSGNMMLDILRSHPLTLVNGVVQENPFFTPPDQFLEELRNRARRRTASA